MPVHINIAGDTAAAALAELHQFAKGMTGALQATQPAPVETPPAEPVAEVVTPSKTPRKKAPAAEAVIEQPKQTDIEDVTGAPANDAGERALTIEQVRELTRGWSRDGHMECISAEMEARGVKKMSAIDPDAGDKPSALFGAYATAIEARIAAKKATEAPKE